MANKESAIQWLTRAWHDLSSARLLYDADHFTDTIASDLQQAIEKMLKTFLAYENERIRKTHDLIELSKLIEDKICFVDSEKELLDIATTYYTQDRYPGTVDLPVRSQINEVLVFAERLFPKICSILEIDKKQIN